MVYNDTYIFQEENMAKTRMDEGRLVRKCCRSAGFPEILRKIKLFFSKKVFFRKYGNIGNTKLRYLLVFTNVCTFIVIKILHKQSLT